MGPKPLQIMALFHDNINDISPSLPSSSDENKESNNNNDNEKNKGNSVGAGDMASSDEGITSDSDGSKLYWNFLFNIEIWHERGGPLPRGPP